MIERPPISPWKSDARRNPMSLMTWEELSYVSDEMSLARNHLIYMLLDHFCRLYFFIFIQISLHNIHQPWLHDLTLWIWFGKLLSYGTWFSDLDAPWFHTPQSHTEGIASGWGRQHHLEFGVHISHWWRWLILCWAQVPRTPPATLAGFFPGGWWFSC